ncbi:MAG: hypothetical protein MJ097_00480 [Dorea sp.]|nr:hypothetical protein [Dorea sp.]
MFIDEPFFMTNDDWYYFDGKEKRYKLTEEAPEEAVDSYKEFYNLLEEVKEGD